MSRRAVNIATISEEDILEEEIGEDGTVAMVTPDRLSRESFDSESDINGWITRKKEAVIENLERRDSMVEKEEDNSAEVSNSILSAISSLEGTLPRRTPSPTLSTSSRSSLESPRAPSPAGSRANASKGTSAAAGSPSPSSNLRRNFSWRGSGRSTGSTLNLSGKFATELTLYDPASGPVKSRCINLGLFIATDQVMGDHSVYKISPMSPLSALKIQQQDRLLKVNDISVMGWSHNCLLEFIRNLPLASSNPEVNTDSTFEMPISMEFRKAGKHIRSAEESPSSKRVAATVKIRNQRATVLSVHESIVRVRFGFSYNARLKLKGERALYLKTITASNNTVNLSVGEMSTPHDKEVSFRLHQFDVSPPRGEPGDVVAIETPGGEGYLQAISLDYIAIMQGLTAPPSTFLQSDIRFFHIASVSGTPYIRIRNIHTGYYLSASKDKIALLCPGNDMSLPNDTLFEIQKTDH